MAKMDLIIRQVRLHDAFRIATIYDYHVRHGTASFETAGPSVADTERKIDKICSGGWPFLVAELDELVVGYAYATQFRDRAAYAYCCENSIYVDAEQRGRGIGRKLLQSLCDEAESFGFRQMLAVVGGGEEASVRVHASCGFRQVGRMEAVGWKKGRWLDTVYMQKSLGMGCHEPPRQRQE